MMWLFINKIWDYFVIAFPPVAILCLLVAVLFILLFIWGEWKNYKMGNILLFMQNEFSNYNNLLEKAIDAVRIRNGVR